MKRMPMRTPAIYQRSEPFWDNRQQAVKLQIDLCDTVIQLIKHIGFINPGDK